LSCPDDVRFTPDGDQTANIPVLPLRANAGYQSDVRIKERPPRGGLSEPIGTSIKQLARGPIADSPSVTAWSAFREDLPLDQRLRPHQFRTRDDPNKPDRLQSVSNENSTNSTKPTIILPLITVWLQVRAIQFRK
jgi:hypothetical protein